MSLSFEAETGHWPLPHENDGSSARIHTYAVLAKDAEDFATITALVPERPTAGAYIPVEFMARMLAMIELERTKELAKKHKMNLREVNDKAGLGTNSICNWKNKRPGGDALEAVAEVLNSSIDYLKGKTDDPTPIPTKGQPTSIPLDEEKPYSYHGYNVPERYLNMVRGLMEDDIKEGRADKK